VARKKNVARTCVPQKIIEQK